MTRKVGPLPVWAWAAVILGAYLLYSHFHPSSATAASTPVGADPGSDAQQPASGQGNAADNLNGQMLDLLLSGQDNLLSMLQSSTAGGATTTGAGYGTSTPGPHAAALSNNAPPSSFAPAGVASTPAIEAPPTDQSGAPGTAAYIAATTGAPAVYSDPGGPPLIGNDARMAHPSPAQLASGAKLATAQSETYAKQVTAAAQGYHTAGF